MLIKDGSARRLGQWVQLVSAPHPHFSKYEGVGPAHQKVTREKVLPANVLLSLRKNMDKLISHWYKYSLE